MLPEAHDLMVALRRLIDHEEDVHEGYGDAAVALMAQGQFEYASHVFQAGHSHGQRARELRTELAAVEAKYGAV